MWANHAVSPLKCQTHRQYREARCLGVARRWQWTCVMFLDTASLPFYLHVLLCISQSATVASTTIIMPSYVSARTSSLAITSLLKILFVRNPSLTDYPYSLSLISTLVGKCVTYSSIHRARWFKDSKSESPRLVQFDLTQTIIKILQEIWTMLFQYDEKFGLV